MKKTATILVLAILLFIGLTYWSVSGDSGREATCRIVGETDMDSMDFGKYDSVVVAAATLYEGDLLKNLMQGKNYREAWGTPVRIPIVFLDTLCGGLSVIEEGGGKQTHSLELESCQGIRYTLRSVNKDPEPLVPEFARRLGLENIVMDGISAQHPYAAAVVASLAESACLLHPRPRVVFVPKQPLLGKFNQRYGNKLYLFEFESEGEVNWTSVPDVIRIMDTDDLQAFKLEHPEELHIAMADLIRARLFDLVIGDWDRHAKQWGWVVQKQNNGYLAKPLPVDRDNAFFHIGGIIPAIISDRNITPGMQSFGKDIDYLPGLVMDIDVYFLKGASEAMFLEQAAKLREYLTDAAIEKAFRLWPKDIYELDARKIMASIRDRRDHLTAYASAFHTELDNREFLTEPLKGSEDEPQLLQIQRCFECRGSIPGTGTSRIPNKALPG